MRRVVVSVAAWLLMTVAFFSLSDAVRHFAGVMAAGMLATCIAALIGAALA